MRNAGGYAMIVDPDAPLRESDTVTCFHCSRVVFVKPGPVPGTGFCRLCMKHLCGPCADKGTCTPFEKKLEAIERNVSRDSMWSRLLGCG